MGNRDSEIAGELKRRFDKDIPGHIRRLVVFGSRAKGEGMIDSDLDIVALVDEKTPELEKYLEDMTYQVMWEYDFSPVISLKIFSESKFKEALDKGFSFYKRIDSEGVLI